jgi:hypothetical protein
MDIYDRLERQGITDIDGEDLKTIEKALKINHITKHNHDKSKLNKTTFDCWSDVVNFLAKNDSSNSMYRDFTIYGYELIHDNHYIVIYHKTHSYNT